MGIKNVGDEFSIPISVRKEQFGNQLVKNEFIPVNLNDFWIYLHIELFSLNGLHYLSPGYFCSRDNQALLIDLLDCKTFFESLSMFSKTILSSIQNSNPLQIGSIE